MKGAKFLTAAGLLIAATLCQAQVYKWTDASGHVHFSDQPPTDNTPAQTVKGAATAPAGAPDEATKNSAPAPKTWQDKEREAKQRKLEQSQADEKRKQEEAQKQDKQAYCDGLQRYMATLERGGRIGRTNTAGELELFSDEQIGKEKEQTRAKLAKDCRK